MAKTRIEGPASAPVASAGPSLAPWLVVVVAALFGVIGLVNVVAQVMYEVKGSRASGQVLEFHQASGRSRSVYATVMAAPAGVAPFRWEVSDTFGAHEWHEGESVPLLCAHIHADHVSCVLDSYPERYLWQLTLTLFGGGIAGFGAAALIRRRTRDAASTPSCAATS